jgi:hypothetical protein
MGPQRLVDMMKGLDVPGIIKVFHMEQFFHMKNSFLGQKGGMALLFQLIILALLQEGMIRLIL